jgi:myo-inositol-1(or 4)-monophosphatase
MPPAAELRRIALDVATLAAQVVLAGWRRNPSFTKKGRTDFVSQFDLASEELIRRELTARAPGLPIVGEEGGGEASRGLSWCCDPLDGTTNFVHGHPIWSVSIAALDNGRPVAGAVVAPVLGTAWSASESGPALRNDEIIRVSPTQEVGEALLATGFPYANRDVEPFNNFSTFARVKQAGRAVRRCGSAAIDCCWVAEGTYDGYWERSVMPWDVAAGAVIIRAAGGRVTSFDLDEDFLPSGHILATNGAVHAELAALLHT